MKLSQVQKIIQCIYLVKTRMQNQRPSRLIMDKIYSTNLDCLIKVKQVEGMKGLYRGLTPHVIASSLGKAFKLSVHKNIFGGKLYTYFCQFYFCR